MAGTQALGRQQMTTRRESEKENVNEQGRGCVGSSRMAPKRTMWFFPSDPTNLQEHSSNHDIIMITS